MVHWCIVAGMPPSNSYSVRLHPDVAKELRAYARGSGRSVDAAIRVLIVKGLAVERITAQHDAALTAEFMDQMAAGQEPE